MKQTNPVQKTSPFFLLMPKAAACLARSGFSRDEVETLLACSVAEILRAAFPDTRAAR